MAPTFARPSTKTWALTVMVSPSSTLAGKQSSSCEGVTSRMFTRPNSVGSVLSACAFRVRCAAFLETLPVFEFFVDDVPDVLG